MPRVSSQKRSSLGRLLTLFTSLPWHVDAAVLLAVLVVSGCTGLLRPLLNLGDEAFHIGMSPASVLAAAFTEAFWYMLVAGVIHVAGVVAGAIALLVVLVWRPSFTYIRLINRWFEFNVILLLWGALGNVVWVAIARNKLYLTCDPVVEWYAFAPYSSTVHDCVWGSFHGGLINNATDSELFSIWACLAVAVWALSWATIRAHTQRT